MRAVVRHRLRRVGRLRGLPAGVFRADRGAAAIEFAIVAPLLISLMLGIVQFGAIFYVWHNMTAAARDTARRVAIGEIGSKAAAETFAAEALGGVVPWAVGFTVAATLPADPSAPGGDVSILITAPLVQAAIVDFLGILGDETLHARAVMRTE